MKRFLSYFSDINKYYLIIFIVLVIIGTYARAANLLGLGFVFDTVETQFRWGSEALRLGYGRFWTDFNEFFDYLPGALLYLMGVTQVSKIFDFIIPGGADQAFVTTTKIFNWIIEIGLAVLIAKIGLKFGNATKTKALLVAGLVYAIPSLWYVSGVWGQIDSLVVLVSLISIYFLYSAKPNYNGPFYKNMYFWSGVLFAIAFWIKVQAIILIPMFLLFNLAGKNSDFIMKVLKGTLLWMFGFSILILLSVYFYFYTTNSIPLLNFLTLLFFAIITLVSYFDFNKARDELRSFNSQFFGFWITTFLIIIIPSFYFASRVLINAAGPIYKENSVGSGAAAFWPLIGVTGYGSDKLFNIGGYGLSVSTVGLILFIGSILILYFKIFPVKFSTLKSEIKMRFNLASFLEKIIPKSFSFTDFALLATIVGGAYFEFMMKMHSRYLIWSIIFSLVSLVLISNSKNAKYWLLALVLMHTGFLFNQFGVYNAWNAEPKWSHTFTEFFAFDQGKFASLFNLLGFIGFYLWYWLNKKFIDQKAD